MELCPVAKTVGGGERKLGSPTAWPVAKTWLRGWIAAAVAQRPDLARVAPGYLERRLAGASGTEVGHLDVLALPGNGS